MKFFNKIIAYIKYKQACRIIKKYPLEFKMDMLLVKISNNRSHNPQTVFNDSPLEVTAKEGIAIIGQLKKDGYIKFVEYLSGDTKIEFPSFKITESGMLFHLKEGYVNSAYDKEKKEKQNREAAFLTRLNIITGFILVISLLFNILYIFGIITWNLQDSTKYETEQSINDKENNRQNAYNHPVGYDSTDIYHCTANDQYNICREYKY